VRLAGRDLVRRVPRAGADLQVGDDGAALLGEPGLVEAAHVLASGQGGGAEELVHGDDAGPADAQHTDRGLRRDPERGVGQGALDREDPALLLPRPAERRDGQERRAVAAETRVVLVAARLVDLGLPAELGLDRVDGKAVRLGAAVAAALTHGLVDVHARRGVRQPAALAQAPLLGGAALVVDQRGHAANIAEHTVGLVEAVASRPVHAAGR